MGCGATKVAPAAPTAEGSATNEWISSTPDCPAWISGSCPENACPLRHHICLGQYCSLQRNDRRLRYPALCKPSCSGSSDCPFVHGPQHSGTVRPNNPQQRTIEILALWDTENLSPRVTGDATAADVAQALKQLIRLASGSSLSRVTLYAIHGKHLADAAPTLSSLEVGGAVCINAGPKAGSVDRVLKDMLNDRLVETLRQQRDLALSPSTLPLSPAHQAQVGLAIISGDKDFSADLRRARLLDDVWTCVIHQVRSARDYSIQADCDLPWQCVRDVANAVHASYSKGARQGARGVSSPVEVEQAMAQAESPLIEGDTEGPADVMDATRAPSHGPPDPHAGPKHTKQTGTSGSGGGQRMPGTQAASRAGATTGSGQDPSSKAARSRSRSKARRRPHGEVDAALPSSLIPTPTAGRPRQSSTGRPALADADVNAAARSTAPSSPGPRAAWAHSVVAQTRPLEVEQPGEGEGEGEGTGAPPPMEEEHTVHSRTGSAAAPQPGKRQRGSSRGPAASHGSPGPAAPPQGGVVPAAVSDP